MEILAIIILLTIYAGMVISVIFRMNQCRVLEGRVGLAFLLPFLHFIIFPLCILFLQKNIGLIERFKIIWLMTILFPCILSLYCARLGRENKKRTYAESEMDMYRGVCIDMSEKANYAC